MTMKAKQWEFSNSKTILAIPDHYVCIGRKQAQASAASGIVTAENGKSAITILEHNPVDVIITDLLMPSMTGLALIREMKKRKSSIPIIIITAYGNTEMVKEIIAEGVFRLIEKPLDFDTLIPIVHEAIEYKKNQENK